MMENNSDQPEAQNRGLRVLVSDPHRDSATALELLLRYWGHVAVIAESRQEMRAIEGIDVALVEPFAPGIREQNVVPLIRENNPHAVLLAYTSWGQREDIHTCLEQGFHEHLLKPYEPEKLKSLLAELSFLPSNTNPELIPLYRQTCLLRWQTKMRMQKLAHTTDLYMRNMDAMRADVSQFLADLERTRQKIQRRTT